jgi:hypothetical protein
MVEDSVTAPRGRWFARCLMAVIAVAMVGIAYVLSIGPVYYCWARWDTNMANHEILERFYSPVLESGPAWLRRQLIDYREVARLAGYRGEAIRKE